MSASIFDSRNIEYKKPFGAVCAGTKIKFCIHIDRSLAVKHAVLAIKEDAGKPFMQEMQWTGISGADDIFVCEYEAGDAGLYFYWFEIKNRGAKYFISRGEHSKGILVRKQENMFQQSVFEPSYKTPGWIKGGIMYQIFPDRFSKGKGILPDKTQGRVLLQEWGNLPPQSEESGYCSNLYFGGNLDGITSKLSYLASLGVTAIYLNPIFEAHSYHRYNTADYMKIDPLLGNEEDFKRLCAKAREAGIRVVLDGVFSHTGADSIYFNKNGRYKDAGAYQSKDSAYYDWFDFEKWPDKYRCWWGIDELPETNEDGSSFLGFITGENGVLDHWLKLGASGWRLDVTDELPDKFLEKLNSRVKGENPENIIIGEVWEDASNKISYSNRRHYLEGRQLDSVMNYPWRSAIINYIKSGSAQPLEEAVMTILENYPKETVDTLMNILGTHDTLRLLTCFAGESQVGKSIEWKQNTHLSPERRKTGLVLVRLASAIQYLLPGVPCVYYGDEAGFEGYEDPFNRQCYMWGEEDKSLLEWYKRLGALRKSCPVLESGEYRPLAANGGLFAFERALCGESVLLAVNAGLSPVEIKASGKLCLSYKGAELCDGVLTLPPLCCAVVGNGGWEKNVPVFKS